MTDLPREDQTAGPEESSPALEGVVGGDPVPESSPDSSAESSAELLPDAAPDTPESLLDGSLDPAPAEQSAHGRPVVSDGTAGEGDSAEPVRAGSGAEQAYADEHPDTVLAAERLVDLQRLQAEYVNYKRRVDRDRDLARDAGTAAVLEALLPVLDDIHLAREHGDLADGPFAAIADKLAAALTRFGVAEIGAAGQEFDPTVHEALMHVQAELPEGATATTVVQVLQPGYKIGERVIRPARVSVADPQ